MTLQHLEYFSFLVDWLKVTQFKLRIWPFFSLVDFKILFLWLGTAWFNLGNNVPETIGQHRQHSWMVPFVWLEQSNGMDGSVMTTQNLARLQSASVVFTGIRTISTFSTAVLEMCGLLHTLKFYVMTCCCFPIKTMLPFLGHSNYIQTLVSLNFLLPL